MGLRKTKCKKGSSCRRHTAAQVVHLFTVPTNTETSKQFPTATVKRLFSQLPWRSHTSIVAFTGAVGGHLGARLERACRRGYFVGSVRRPARLDWRGRHGSLGLSHPLGLFDPPRVKSGPARSGLLLSPQSDAGRLGPRVKNGPVRSGLLISPQSDAGRG